MKWILVYRDEELGCAWNLAFQGAVDVELFHGDINKVACDAIVSPANSFGFMDGGLDYALSERFGWDLQTRLQEVIRELPERELLVGKALAVPTSDETTPWLIAAPTMRVPMSYQIATSMNAFLAMKALLLVALSKPEISTVAIPGLCTGVGRMPPQTAALQMYAAYAEVVLDQWPDSADFGDAQRRQVELSPDSLIWDY